MGLIGWLVSAGFCAVGIAAGLWGLTEVSKTIVIWIVGIPGAICLVIALGLELQNLAEESIVPRGPNVNEIADKSFVEGNRPWLNVTATPVMAELEFKGFRGEINLVLTNVGRSPARRVRILVRALYPSEDGKPFDVGRLQRELCDQQRSDTSQTGSIVFPGSPVTKQFSAVTPNDFLLRRLKEGNDYLTPWIVVCVAYDFDAGRPSFLTSLVLQFGPIHIAGYIPDAGIRKPFPNAPFLRLEQFDLAE
jgi:hypothetical protein